MRPRDPLPPTPSARRPVRRGAPPLALALLPFLLSACSDSGTDVHADATMSAEMTGDRETSFRGDASSSTPEGVFVLRGEGIGFFQGHEMEFVATSQDALEAGTYSIGEDTGEEPGPDLVGTWLMEIALFTATDGTLTVEEAGGGAIRGTFAFTAIRTHVCQSDGFCTEVPDEEPEEGQVEGSFEVTGAGS